MEKGIKILEEFINNDFQKDKLERNEKGGFKIGTIYKTTELNPALENLIKGYRELEEENKIIKGNYYTLCADIQMVTSELGFPEDTIIADEMVSMIKENYIEKSLVEEKIEELSEDLEIMKVDAMYGRYKEYGSKLSFEKQFSYKYGMHDVLQELLEKRE